MVRHTTRIITCFIILIMGNSSHCGIESDRLSEIQVRLKAMVQWLTFLKQSILQTTKKGWKKNVNNILLNVLLFRMKHHTEDIYYIGNIGTRMKFYQIHFYQYQKIQCNERNAVFGTEIYGMLEKYNLIH